MKRLPIRRFASAAFVLGAVSSLSAGTLCHWQAWLYMAVLFVPMTAVVRHLLRNDPELLVRRLDNANTEHHTLWMRRQNSAAKMS